MLSELVAKAAKADLNYGTETGKCAFCGVMTNEGHKAVFSDSFMNAPSLSGGEVVCPYCNHMMTADIPGAKQSAGKRYRANMWYACEDGIGVIRFPRKEDSKAPAQRDVSAIFPLPEQTPRAVLVEPPKPPFAVYLTRTWKQTGWQSLIRLNGGVAFARDVFPVGFDYEPLYVNRPKLLQHLEKIDTLRGDPKKPNVSKTELQNGHIGAYSMKKLTECGFNPIKIESELCKVSNDPLWSLAVYVA